MAGPEQSGRKLRRISRACDYCHSRSIRCDTTSQGERRCRNCIDFGQPCTYDRVVRRRGVKPKRTPGSETTPRGHVSAAIPGPSGSSGSETNRTLPLETRNRGHVSALFPGSSESPGIETNRTVALGTRPRGHVSAALPGSLGKQSMQWQAPQVATQAVIMDLVEIYFEIVYPVFPFFHRPTLLRKISRGEYNSEPKLFAVTMAVCALVSARTRDGAIFNPAWNVEELLETSSEVFYHAALKECQNTFTGDRSDLNVLRTYALLAIIAIQYGNPREMQKHLGWYHTLVAMDGLHDQANWPKDIGIVETEERRRLFWSMYTLDIYSSIVWNGVIRSREQQSNVSYTTEIDDELFDNSGYRHTTSAQSPLSIGVSPTSVGDSVRTSSWLCGWNFITDLYRALEHVITMFRDRPRYKRSFLRDICGNGNTSDGPISSPASVRDRITSMYSSLPQCFKETEAITCDLSHDRYGFQAANITATVQLLRMVLFSAGGATIEDRCQIASEVVDAFMRIPVQYLRAISSPLLNHLAGIGAILGSVFEEPLSESGYQQVRVVLLSLAQLLENLDHGTHSLTSAEKLRSQVAKIDEYMADQRRDPHSPLHRMLSASASLEPYDVSQTHGSSTTGDPGTSSLPFPLPVDLFGEWPWTLNVMQFPES